MPQPELQQAINYALSAEHPDEMIAGVKQVVHDELRGLDPTADIEQTSYFNHTYVPDYVVSWREAGKPQRDVYLRYSVSATRAGDDVNALASLGPMLIALRGDEERSDVEEESVRREVRRAPRLLLTDVPSLGRIGDGGDAGSSAGASPREVQPILALARSNVMRGGRGFLDREAVDRLAAGMHEGGTVTDEEAERFKSVVNELFVDDAAFRLQRAAEVLRIGVSGDLSTLSRNDHHEDGQEQESGVLHGSFSQSELRVLLPYLLGRSDVTQDSDYWSLLGSMLNLEQIEQMADVLAGLDLTPLLAANLRTWTATRASLVINPELLEEGTLQDPPRGWRMRSRLVSLAAGNWFVQVAADGRKIRGRDDSPAAAWDDVQSILRRFKVSSVDLHGAERRVRISAAEAGDVFGDIASIRENLDDHYFVPEVSLLVQGEDGDAVAEVNFRKMTVTGNRVFVADLARIATEVLGYRFPVDAAILENLM